jgi:hypothetical protein
VGAGDLTLEYAGRAFFLNFLKFARQDSVLRQKFHPFGVRYKVIIA